MNRRAASGAEVVDGRLAAVRGSPPFLRLTLDLYALGRPARLGGKDAPCSLLTSEAVADGYADRFTRHSRAQLAAAAGGGAFHYFATFFNANRTNASSETSAPSSSCAELTAALAS